MTDRQGQSIPGRARIAAWIVAGLGSLATGVWILFTGPDQFQYQHLAGYVFALYSAGSMLGEAERLTGIRRRARWSVTPPAAEPAPEREDEDRRERWAQAEESAVRGNDEVAAWPRQLDGDVWPDERATQDLTEHSRPLHKPGPY